MSKKGLQQAKISKDFLQKYSIVQNGDRVHNISNFRSIGWSDPFPDDDKFVIGSVDDDIDAVVLNDIDDYVYDKSKFIHGVPPCVKFVPT